MALRDATPDDIDVICELIRALGDYEQLSHEVVFDRDEAARHLFGAAPSAHVVLATDVGDDDTNVVVGFALWFPTFSTFLGRPGIWLEDLFVRPQYWGRGHGLALLQSLRDRTDGRVEWAVLDWNTPAIDFYRALGAEPVEGWTRYRWVR